MNGMMIDNRSNDNFGRDKEKRLLELDSFQEKEKFKGEVGKELI
jgi:hypothetical protein